MAFKEEVGKTGESFDETLFQRGLKASWAYFNALWKNEYRTPSAIESVTYFWNFLNLTYNELAINKIAKAFGDCILLEPPSLITGVKEVITDLYKMNITLGIISDTGFSPGLILRELLEKNGILQYFTYFSFSDETRVSKPHPLAFRTILEPIGISPAESLHIGDIEKTDIEGAKNFGMKAIRFSGDKTNEIYKENSEITVADAEISSWSEFWSEFQKMK